jgi:hypothetical protein
MAQHAEGSFPEEVMPLRYLFGPVSAEFVQQNLRRARQDGACLAFDAAGTTDLAVGPGDTWEAVLARLPGGWRPDFVVLYPCYSSVPGWLWSAPVPLVAWPPTGTSFGTATAAGCAAASAS